MRPSLRASALLAAIHAVFAPLGATAAAAADAPPPQSAAAPERLVVGVFDAPPYSEPSRDGGWSGTSIRLFSAAAARLAVAVEFRSGSEKEILDALASGEIDACASPLAPTASRVDSMQFMHAFASLGLGAAVRDDAGLIGEFRAILDSILSPAQYRLYATIAAFVFVAAGLVWIAERRRNPHFGGRRHSGFGSSLWWSVVTLSTVGYGDKVPTTLFGRAVAAGWMILSLVLTTILTATIVSAITVGSISSQPISRAADLSGITVVAVRGSVAAEWLSSQGIPFRAVDSVDAAAALVASGDARAMVAPRAEIAVVARSRPEIAVSPVALADEFAAFAFRLSMDPQFVRRFDRAVLEVRAMLEPGRGVVPVEALGARAPAD